MSETKQDQELSLSKLHQKLTQPTLFNRDQLLVNENKVAGHAGFYSIKGQPNVCLKPFNIKCVRGRRECLFYQLIEYFNHNESTSIYNSDPNSEINPDIAKLRYNQFTLLIPPGAKCTCILDKSLFLLLSSFMPKFYHVKHLSDFNGPAPKLNIYNLFESKQASCPCYGTSAKAKSSCSKDYEKNNFFCLEDLTSHCSRPCIIDIKIGQITYDPMAIKEKILEQSSKYQRLREFGFRILGMKQGAETKDKNFGKALETDEQVYAALDSFFFPLIDVEHKIVVLNRILERLKKLVTLFEEKNSNQLKFFSSSILIVYDTPNYDHSNVALDVKKLADHVRISMIDFAHVFHVHSSSDGVIQTEDDKDYNYLYGLKKLEQYFIRLCHHYQTSLPHFLQV